MALSGEIRALRDRVLGDLNSSYDYYTDTKFAWRLVRVIVAAGHTFSHQNLATGTVTTQAELSAKARGYVTEQLTEATFQQFISLFENFYLDLLHLWLTAYPRSLGGRKVDFKTVLDLPDKAAVTEYVVGKVLNEVLYERPAGWFAYLEEKVKLGCPSPDEIERIAEAKATRDVLVHNRRVANTTYESKAGKFARFQAGDTIDVPEPYHRSTWELIRKVVSDVSNAAIARVP